MEAENDMIMYMMHMTFYQGSDAVFLFKDFETTNDGGYILGLIITFFLAVIMESLSFVLFFIKIKAKSTGKSGITSYTFIMMGVYFLQLILAFALM